MSIKLAIVLLAVAALGVSGQPLREDEGFDCTGKADGYHADVSDPRAFYACMDGVLTAKVVCQQGFYYSPGSGDCLSVEKHGAVSGAGNNQDEHPDHHDDDDDDDDETPKGRKIVNVEVNKNVFPKSLLIIGKLDREMRNN